MADSSGGGAGPSVNFPVSPRTSGFATSDDEGAAAAGPTPTSNHNSNNYDFTTPPLSSMSVSAGSVDSGSSLSRSSSNGGGGSLTRPVVVDGHSGFTHERVFLSQPMMPADSPNHSRDYDADQSLTSDAAEPLVSDTLCVICQVEKPVFSCFKCDIRHGCADCMIRRHSVGTLSRHALNIIRTAEAVASAPSVRIGAPCGWCRESASVLLCTSCEVGFCSACAKSFHNISGDESSMQTHMDTYVRSSSPTSRRTASVMESSKAIWDRALSRRRSFRQSKSGALHRRKESNPLCNLGTTTATFRLKAYGLGISDAEILVDSVTPQKNRTQHYINIDQKKKQFSVFSKKENNSLLSTHTRSFESLKQVVRDEGDRRHFSLYFNDSKAAAQCLANNGDEATQICQILDQVISKQSRSREDASSPEPPSSNVLFRGVVLKQGKMKKDPRWIVIKAGHLEVHKEQESSVAHTDLLLQDPRVYIEANAAPKLKYFTVHSNDKAHIFKCESEAERDTIVSLLRKCAQLVSIFFFIGFYIYIFYLYNLHSLHVSTSVHSFPFTYRSRGSQISPSLHLSRSPLTSTLTTSTSRPKRRH